MYRESRACRERINTIKKKILIKRHPSRTHIAAAAVIARACTIYETSALYIRVHTYMYIFFILYTWCREFCVFSTGRPGHVRTGGGYGPLLCVSYTRGTRYIYIYYYGRWAKRGRATDLYMTAVYIYIYIKSPSVGSCSSSSTSSSSSCILYEYIYIYVYTCAVFTCLVGFLIIFPARPPATRSSVAPARSLFGFSFRPRRDDNNKKKIYTHLKNNGD